VALTEKSLYANDAPTSNTTVYTVPAATKTRITEIMICNNAAATRTIRLYFVPNGDVADVGNAHFYDYDLPQGRPIIQPMNTFLPTAGDLISAHASGASVALRISGIEKT
jgi:hypothetical protein